MRAIPDKIIARGTGGGHFTPSPKPSKAKQAFSGGPYIAGLDPDPEPAAPALSADEVRAVEGRADVDALGDLHQRRRQLLVTLAPLKALHGPFGLFDDRRKRMLESLKVRARSDLSASRDKKPTEGEIDATAYADPQYEAFLDEAYQAKIDYLNQATELSEIEERIRSRELELVTYAAEVRLGR
jgi:hypothetical protein